MPNTTRTWATRPETTADIGPIRALTAAAFDTEAEADIVDALRADPEAWIEGLGFTPASGFGVHAPFEVPDEAMMALSLDPERPTPRGTIRYPDAFGV
ncbi:hypothetical protein ACFW3Z_07345 [Nocardiopsis alba]|uniref:hypothetical protein n=1 Tax=Nocardiopsis alba TaxID=53437 RepID=UPI00366FF363